MVSTVIDTGVRQLSSWTQEMAQEISMYHSIDVEAELIKQLKREMRTLKLKRIIAY